MKELKKRLEKYHEGAVIDLTQGEELSGGLKMSGNMPKAPKEAELDNLEDDIEEIRQTDVLE